MSFLGAPEAQAGFETAAPYGHFTSKTGEGGSLSERFEFAPQGALSLPVPKTPITFGLGVLPAMTLSGNWNYPDPPGGLGGTVSYGQQRDNSRIVDYKFVIGMSVKLAHNLSIGGALNLNYNENLLQTPYIFQSQPVLRGFKTILNLSSYGWGANGTAGLLYQPTDKVSIGLSYQSRAIVKTHGEATGNASAQLNALGPGYAGVPRDFHYNAEVDNTFPQVVTGGVAWKFLPGWEASLEVDWTNWADAFDTLPVKLSQPATTRPSTPSSAPQRWRTISRSSGRIASPIASVSNTPSRRISSCAAATPSARARSPTKPSPRSPPPSPRTPSASAPAIAGSISRSTSPTNGTSPQPSTSGPAHSPLANTPTAPCAPASNGWP